MLYPATVEVLGLQFKPTLCCGAAAPVPVRGSTSGDPDALVENETVADVLPVDCGVNFRVNVAV